MSPRERYEAITIIAFPERFEKKSLAYFSAGLRIVDISDPFKPKEVGFYIPDPTDKTKARGKKVIQTNDVDLDYRGLIYITDRAGTGLHILEYTGGK